MTLGISLVTQLMSTVLETGSALRRVLLLEKRATCIILSSGHVNDHVVFRRLYPNAERRRPFLSVATLEVEQRI